MAKFQWQVNQVTLPGSKVQPVRSQLHRSSALSQLEAAYLYGKQKLTRSACEHEAHHREHGLEVTAIDRPDNGDDDDGNGKDYGNDRELLGP